MKKQLLIIGIIILLFCVGFSGCNQVSNTLNTDKNKFIGTWQNTTNSSTTIIDLFSDGDCSYIGLSGTWDLKNGLLVIETITGHNVTYMYTFSNHDETLLLTSSPGVPSGVFNKTIIEK
jgi:hypothetical protein